MGATITVSARPKMPPPGQLTAKQTRWNVFFVAIALGGFYTLLGQYKGVTFPRSLEVGMLSALGGYLLWVAYHVASRRNNWVIIPIFMNPHAEHYYAGVDNYWFEIALKTLICSSIFLFFGLLCRWLPRPSKREDPLHDGLVEIQGRTP